MSAHEKNKNRKDQIFVWKETKGNSWDDADATLPN